MNNFAIIVTYEPDINELSKLVNSIIGQNFNVILVDNSEINFLDDNFDIEGCKLLRNKQNLGIAYAQNIGIKNAILHGADIITFFDQDSVISDGLLSSLSEPLMKNRLYITAPVSIDRNTYIEYPSQVLNRFGWTSDIYSNKKNELVPVDIAIASGITTSSDVFKIVGFFDEDFFIDFVDIEWCLRAKRNGIQIYVIPGAIMEHSIGEKTISIGPIKFIKHSPMRTYYKVRNSILLFRKKIKFIFVVRQIIPAIIHNFILIFFVEKKMDYLRYYLKGIHHGLIGRTGKL